MKVGELRKQGFKAIAGDTLTNGLSDSIKLSIGGAVAVNEGHHDDLEVVDLLWRDKTSEEYGFKGYTEYSLDGWKPYLGKVYVEYKSVNSNDEKPVFTQAMADAGELPPVGFKCLVTPHNGLWGMTRIGDYAGEVIQYCDGEQFIFKLDTKALDASSILVSRIDKVDFKPLEKRTEKQKAVDAELLEWPLLDKATLEYAYDLWAQKIEQ